MEFNEWFQQKYSLGFDGHTPIKEFLREAWEAGEENAPVDDATEELKEEMKELESELRDARGKIDDLRRARQEDNKKFERIKSLIH